MCGLGAGLVDRLNEMEDNVIGVNNAARSEEPETYHNLRSEILCKAANLFAGGDVQLRITPPASGSLPLAGGGVRAKESVVNAGVCGQEWQDTD